MIGRSILFPTKAALPATIHTIYHQPSTINAQCLTSSDLRTHKHTPAVDTQLHTQFMKSFRTFDLKQSLNSIRTRSLTTDGDGWQRLANSHTNSTILYDRPRSCNILRRRRIQSAKVLGIAFTRHWNRICFPFEQKELKSSRTLEQFIHLAQSSTNCKSVSGRLLASSCVRSADLPPQVLPPGVKHGDERSIVVGCYPRSKPP